MLFGFPEEQLLQFLILYQVSSMVLAFLILTLDLVGQAPYGRYAGKQWWAGPHLPARVMWVLQESPAVLIPFWYLYTTGKWRVMFLDSPSVNTVLIVATSTHYTYRSFIYPMLLRGGKPTTVLTVSLAFVACTVSGLIFSLAFCSLLHYPPSWPYDIRFLGGMALFVVGLYFNIASDTTLRNLRKPGETGYKIPRGGLFEFVSCANYSAEILEWLGLAIAGWSVPTSIMVVMSILNLGPRACSHHRWYKEKFDDYPKNRTALIPYIY